MSSLRCSGEHTFVESEGGGHWGGSSPLYGWRIKKIGLHRGGIPLTIPIMGNPDNNEKAGEVGIS